MRKFTVAEARERFAEALDQADAGSPVFIERRGVRYRLEVDRTKPARKARQPLIEVVDPAVEDGQWHWVATRTGLKFRSRAKPRRRQTS